MFFVEELKSDFFKIRVQNLDIFRENLFEIEDEILILYSENIIEAKACEESGDILVLTLNGYVVMQDENFNFLKLIGRFDKANRKFNFGYNQEKKVDFGEKISLEKFIFLENFLVCGFDKEAFNVYYKEKTRFDVLFIKKIEFDPESKIIQNFIFDSKNSAFVYERKNCLNLLLVSKKGIEMKLTLDLNFGKEDCNRNIYLKKNNVYVLKYPKVVQQKKKKRKKKKKRNNVVNELKIDKYFLEVDQEKSLFARKVCSHQIKVESGILNSYANEKYLFLILKEGLQIQVYETKTFKKIRNWEISYPAIRIKKSINSIESKFINGFFIVKFIYISTIFIKDISSRGLRNDHTVIDLESGKEILAGGHKKLFYVSKTKSNNCTSTKIFTFLQGLAIYNKKKIKINY